MAKSKPKEATAAPKPKGRPKSPDAKGRTRIVMTIRAREEWEDWIDRFAAAVSKEAGVGIRLDRTQAIDVALARAAKALGLPDPPSRY